MSCYVIESDKLFICCKDIKVMEVYEIDSLYIAPVRQKHWIHLAKVHFFDGGEFEALQIGERDIIRGHDLERLMQDLMSLGMMVNREGLCFLKTPERNVLNQCPVEYYRMFDLFDWSKYYVKSKLNKRWVRNDIVTGRPILDTSSEKDVELIENKRLHSSEVMGLKRKYSQDIEELKGKHMVDLAELELIKKKLKTKEDEVETRDERQIRNMENFFRKWGSNPSSNPN